MSQNSETPDVRKAPIPLNSLRNMPALRDKLSGLSQRMAAAKQSYDNDLAEARAIANEQGKHIDIAHRAEWVRNAFKAAQRGRFADFQKEVTGIWNEVKEMPLIAHTAPDKRQVLALIATRSASAELAAAIPLIDAMGPRELESYAGLLLSDVAANEAGVEPSKADLASAAAVLARLNTMKTPPFTSASFARVFNTPSIDGSLAALKEAQAIRERLQDYFLDYSRDGELRPITKMKHANGGRPIEALDDGSKLPETV